MKTLGLIAPLLVSFAVQATDAKMSAALERIPTLTDLCGPVPEAPAHVWRSNPIKPLRKSVDTFIKTSGDWVACAEESARAIAPIVATMQNPDARQLVADRLNGDFAESFEKLNAQSQSLADRINLKLDWTEKTGVAPTGNPRSCVGTGNKETLCYMRMRTIQANINKPFNPVRIKPAITVRLEAPHFDTGYEGSPADVSDAPGATP